jgi:hypothetical protein
MNEPNNSEEAVAGLAAFAIGQLVEAYGSQGFAINADVLASTRTSLEKALQAIDDATPGAVDIRLPDAARSCLSIDVIEAAERELGVAVGRLTASLVAHAAAQMAWLAYRAAAEKEKAAVRDRAN